MIAPHIHSRRGGCAQKRSQEQATTTAKAPTEVEALAVRCGVSPIQKVSTQRDGLGCTNQAHPAEERLAQIEPPRNTVLVDAVRIGNENIVTVGSRHTFYPKKNGPLDVPRYGAETPDETQQRANPGNGRLVDVAAAATPRFQGIPQGFLKPSPRFKTFLIAKYVVALSGRSTNAKRKPPLWGKIK